MAYDRFLIAPINSGLDKSLRPWLIPDDAFAEMNNAYVFRGRVRKRFGSRYSGTGTGATAQLSSRLRINLGNTNGSGNISVTVPGTRFKAGQAFSIGTEIFTVQATGAPVAMLTTGSATVHTFNTTTGALVINGAAAATATYYYPADPVMGLAIYESGHLINQAAFAWDMQFAYTFTAGAWIRSGSAVWHGTNSDFFWDNNFIDPVGDVYLFVSNYFVTNPEGLGTVLDDPIWYFNGTTWAPFSYSPDATLNPTNQQPFTVTRATTTTGLTVLSYVQTAKIIVSFKNSLLLLNTIENNANVSPNFTVVSASTANLTATYANGAAGVGATLTNAGAMAAFSLDGVAGVLNDRVLIKNQTNTFENGIYTITTVGSGAVNWVLTRATDYDQPAEILAGRQVFVSSGTINITTYWMQTATVAAVGTDPILFSQGQITPLNYLTSTNTQYVNRLRYSAPFNSPFARNAWLESNQVFKPDVSTARLNAIGGGFIDAPTAEEIISAEFIKDRLIVYFERSVYEIVFTGNMVEPFRWQKINTELGAEAEFSTVPFDRTVVAIGSTGVHACNGANVQRIDNKVPDNIFTLRNANNGLKRISGIRDYFVETIYWAYPDSNAPSASNIYPDKVLVYNYRNDTWAFNDDCITAFGYFEQGAAYTWANANLTWGQANFPWNSGTIQASFRYVLAGNQEGYVFIVDPEVARNAAVMQISNMSLSGNTVSLTIVDHTLKVGDYISIENAGGVTGINDGIYPVVGLTSSSVVTIQPATFTGTYTGGGVVSRVSNITILSKQWNPYVEQGLNVYLAKIDFGVQRTSNGEITIDYFPSSSQFSLVQAGMASGAILGTNVLETFPYPTVQSESIQTRLWHPVYFQGEGECVQVYIYMSNDQMTDPDIAWEKFQLEGLILYTMPTSMRLQ